MIIVLIKALIETLSYRLFGSKLRRSGAAAALDLVFSHLAAAAF